MDWDIVVQNWQAVLDAVARLGGDTSQLVVERPASESEVKAVEQEIGVPLPTSLRDVLLTFSRRVKFHWSYPKNLRVEPFEQLYGGWLYWSPERIVEAELYRRTWIKEVLSTRGDPVLEAGWDDTLGFHETDVGDCMAIDLSVPDQQPVVYLDHDEDRAIAGLGTDFQDFLLRSSPLGNPGPNSWEWLIFTNAEGYVDPTGENAVLWKKKLGLRT